VTINNFLPFVKRDREEYPTINFLPFVKGVPAAAVAVGHFVRNAAAGEGFKRCKTKAVLLQLIF